MFKKKESYSPAKVTQDQVSELTFLIARMQRNADQVEKNILRAEDLLAVDKQNEQKGLPLKHQKDNADNLAEAEGLLKDLFLDVDRAKKLGHPQASEIENDVSNLHDRWFKDCASYRDVYEQVDDVELKPRIDWGQVLADKQRLVESDEYGPTLSDVEKQIASHNILHKEIESYKTQLKGSSADTATTQRQCAKLLESSLARRNNLATLYEYMSGCNKELAYLSEQEDKIASRDWSDRMVDAPSVRMEYERFKNSGLLSHEGETTRLQEEADNLVVAGHPARPLIKSLDSEVQNEWQRFLNLLICQETHLDNVEDYKRYQLDMETFSESLKRINSTMEPKQLESMSNLERQMHIEGEERAVERNEQRLADLRELSTSIAPLPLRRTRPAKKAPVVALCDWTTDKTSAKRGEKFTLKSNTNDETWDVETMGGVTKSLPSVILLILPPDKDAIAKVDSLGGQLADLKRRRTALLAPSRPIMEVKTANVNVVSSPPPGDGLKARDLTSRLEKVNNDLVKTEKGILDRLRAPLDRKNPTQDLAKRIDDHEKSVSEINHLEAEKAAIQREMQPLVAQTASSTLPTKLSAVNNKMDNVTNLANTYKKKANATMFLEGQIKKVDTMLSGFENRLVKTDTIPDEPNAIETRTQEVQAIQKDVTGRKDDMLKLDRDLESTGQLCSSLQKNHQEYCPDLRRQEGVVKRLKNRFANLNNQLQQRSSQLQDIGKKNQDFQTTVKSLNAFLINMPNNKLQADDDLVQIKTKQNSQKRVVEDIKRKEDDVDRVALLADDLQKLLSEYDANTQKYRHILNIPEEPEEDRFDLLDAVQQKEKDVVNLYSEVLAENEQQLKQMDVAKNIINKNDEVVSRVVVKQQMQMQSQQRNQVEVDGLKRELGDEINRRTHTENDLEIYQKRLQSLRSRRGVERLEEKEIVQYYRDPKLEAEIEALKKKVGEESKKRTGTHTEIDVMKQKILRLERELASIEPKMVTKVVTEYEKDPQLDKEMERIREEMRRLRDEVTVRHRESLQLHTTITTLEQKRPTIRERVVKKEVIRLEKDPVMLKAVYGFQNDIADEQARCKGLNDDIFQTRSKINTLERIIPTVQPKIITKEVTKVEQDPEMLSESKTLHNSLNRQMQDTNDLLKEITTLRLRYSEEQKLKPRMEVKEIINEIYRVDPDTEVELRRLKRDIQQSGRRRTDLEREMEVINTELYTLRSQKPKVEYKEVTQEVVKEERSPEIVREMQRLNDQLTLLRTRYETTHTKVGILSSQRDDLKTEKSKVTTNLVNKEVIKYENDPLLEKEADRLRRDVRDETQQRRHVEEAVFDLQHKYLLLERQKPEEKIVLQEVLRLEKDPRQIMEHERLSRNMDDELKARRRLELEVKDLRALVLEKERQLAEMDDRQKKILVETELRQIKNKIYELEHAPAPVEERIVIKEILKVERDPKLDVLITGSRVDMEKEENLISRLERDIRNLQIKLDILRKEKSLEKIVYKEVIRVEKDPTQEAERSDYRSQVSQAKNARRDVEEELERLNTRLTRLHTSRSSSSQEETTVTLKRDNLQREKDNLLDELRRLESDKETTTISFQQQSRLLSERNQQTRQKSIKMESEVLRLEKDISDEKETIHKRDITIMELQGTLKNEDHNETHTRETNVSTRITILDPETGKDMSPYDAYVLGLIDRNQYMHLQELECNWEEITTEGSDITDTSVLRDRKSGKQYSITEALKAGRLTQYDLQLYKDGKMPISEFALLVAGEKKPPSLLRSLSKSTPDLNSPTYSPTYSSPTSSGLFNRSQSNGSLNTLINPANPEEHFPISGVIDVTTNSRMSVRSAMTRKLIDHETGLKLLEAQAATGGIVDLNKKDRFSVHKAVQYGLIDKSQMHQLLNAQKAFTGVEDPVTKGRLSVGQAAQKGWIPEESALWYMESQHVTGGLVDPNKAGRIPISEAIGTDIIDDMTAKELQDESKHHKVLVDPVTKEKITLQEAMDRCKKDPINGLLLLPAASTGADNTPSYSNHNYSRV
ncbi:envoplakin [Engraulis encrasicolus]|uniref:envoplakin n=1 Tax=Engraulis encrasicolus TaxID=184585 RepID=UPI002FD34EE7